MTSPPWRSAVPAGTTPRHGRGASRHRRATRSPGTGARGAVQRGRAVVGDASTWITVAVVTVAAAGGVGTATLVHAPAATPGSAAAAGLSPATGVAAGLSPATGVVAASGDLDPLRAAAERSGVRAPATATDATAVAVDAPAVEGSPIGLGTPVRAADGPVDARPLPLPGVVDRDTVGPLWLTPDDRAAGLLSLDVPEAAGGVLDVVPGASPPGGGGPVRSVRVEVERGLPVDGAAFAATVMATLNDPRGWGARGEVTFARTDGVADVRVVLASPDLVDALCAPLDTGGEVSCGRNGHAALNFRRWVLATPEFADRTQYRQYLVNHEVGHLLGHQHEECPGSGQPAPLMQQQSLGVAPCEPNGWPYPQG